MVRLKVREASVNHVTLAVGLEGSNLARIYRARRASGPYEEIGIAFEAPYVDTVDLELGRTYYYRAVSTRKAQIYPDDGWQKVGRPVAATVPRPPKQRRLMATRKRQEFAISVGGYLDESNTVTKGPEVYCPGPGGSNPPYDQVFEPNLCVAMENVGETDVVNPWVVANGQRDWWSVEKMTAEIDQLAGGKGATSTERAMAIWQFCVDEFYDSRAGLAFFDSVADPVKLLNVYGFEGCVANAIAARRLAEAKRIKAREIWLGGKLDGYGRGRGCAHDIFEAYTDGSWHFLDTDLMVFFLKRDNVTVAGSQDLARDIDLLRRSHRNLGLCGKDLPEKDFYYTQFHEGVYVYPPTKGGAWADNAGRITQPAGRYPQPHTMGFRLRPGEKLVRYWGDVGKKVLRAGRLHPDVRYSNGALTYRPDLRLPRSLKGMESTRNLAQETSGRRVALHPNRVGEVSEVVWKVESPYAIAGARVGVTCRRETLEDGIEILASRDGKNWRSVWAAMTLGLDACVELDWFLNPAVYDWREERDMAWRMGPCYAYYIKVAMWAGSRPEGVGLDAIRINTDIQCATRSLPSLFCGKNTIAYRDDNGGPRKVRVTYGWQEEHVIRPPGAPEPVYPKAGAEVNRLDFEFRWRKPVGNGARIDDYHVQVSRYPDFRWCVCPTFDRYVGRTKYAGKARWQAEFPNLLNPDEVYYWRVRARNAKGVWGAWSEARRFVPHGPRLPVGLRVKSEGRSRVLVWKANPEGNRPVTYRVYGSVEPGGFSATEADLLGEVAEPRWPPKGGKKGVSYRVVAVDARGVPSTPSDHVAF